MFSLCFFSHWLPLLAVWVVPTLAQRNLDCLWSDLKYGPDGPWQAVRVTVGGFNKTLKIASQNHADMDLYPGGVFNSFTFSKEACSPYPNSECGEGGTWEPDANATDFIPPEGWHPPIEDASYGLMAGPVNYTSRAMTIRGTTVWDTGIIHTNEGNISYFRGMTRGMRLGYLALGGDQTVQTFDESPDQNGINRTTNVFSGKLYDDKIIGSHSYALHIGSAAFEYPGSLVFGGYNKGRVIGPVTSFKSPDLVDLLDIKIGVEHGESPFKFEKMENLLVSDTGSIGVAQEVAVDPKTPYLSLPDNTCEGLANILPIKFDSTTGFYLWQTKDPAYKKIVTSPAYLGFVFPPGLGDSTNVTIKVPFALLNLTLDKPIIDTPTQYFPCHSFSPSKDDHFRLGRAFLQAAFLGRNWATQITWLAQAPGPGFRGLGLGDQIIDIPDGATTIEAWDSTEKNYFNQTWTGHWSIIDSPKTNKTGENTTETGSPLPRIGDTDQGLSTGAKAGIGVGIIVFSVVAIAIGLCLWRRRKPAATEMEATGSEMGHTSPGHVQNHIPYEPQEMEMMKSPQELQSGGETYEMPDRHDPRWM